MSNDFFKNKKLQCKQLFIIVGFLATAMSLRDTYNYVQYGIVDDYRNNRWAWLYELILSFFDPIVPMLFWLALGVSFLVMAFYIDTSEYK